VATPTGDDVTVEPVVTLPGGLSTTTVQLTFDSVETGGVTTITASSSLDGGGTEAPSGFEVGDPPIYYDVNTTASFTGPVTLCFSWQEGQFENENNIKVFHHDAGAWQDVTSSLDSQSNTICGQVTSLSPFAMFEAAFTYEFAGFFPPVDNPPTRNVAKAGSAIPVKFTLNGDHGLAIVIPGYPASQPILCDSSSPIDSITETSTAGSSGLSYDAASDQYVYVWKTQKAWAGTCRRFILKLVDGTEHTADFGFKK
jgi:hypothetical protein